MLKVIDDNTFDFKDTTTDENIINISEAESDSEGDDVLDRYMAGISKGQQQTNGNSRSHEDMIEMELTEYKNEPELPTKTRGERNFPLEWWKSSQNRFPILSRLARIYLAVQATSASSGRVFPKAERVISKRRTNLSPEGLDL